VCVEVFSDVPGGVLAARRPRDGDDVSLMTSSVSNIRRTCSYYEPTSSSTQLYVQQEQGCDVDGKDDVINDVTLAQRVELECADDVFNDVTQTSSAVDEDETSLQLATSSVLPAAAVAAALAATRPVPVIPRRPRPDSVSAVTPADADRQRPTPPVSRVKPMPRHNDIQLKTFADNNATAHASSSRPVPVPARRRAAIKTVDDIPSDLATLSVADVAKCVTLLGLGEQQADELMRQNVDGPELVKLTDTQLTDEFHFTPLDAKKLARFTRGWRPT